MIASRTTNKPWRAALRLIAWILLLGLTTGITRTWTHSESLTPYAVDKSLAGPMIRFTQFDYVNDDGLVVPQTSAWVSSRSERLWAREMPVRNRLTKTVFARVRFDARIFGAAPLSVFTQDNREQLIVYLNGVDIFRNFTRPDERVRAWYRPYAVPLPRQLLKEGLNEVVVRAAGDNGVEVGRIIVGPSATIEKLYNWQYFWRVAAPVAANYATLAIGAIALLLWMAQRNEFDVLFLSVTCAIWFVSNLHFFVSHEPPFRDLFDGVTFYGVFYAMWSTLSFCLLYLKDPKAWLKIWSMLAVGITFTLLAIYRLFPVPWFYALTFNLDWLIVILAWRDFHKSHATESRVILGLMGFTMVTAMHDLGRIAEIHLWQGADFHFRPFYGFLFSVAFVLFFLRRSLSAFSALEQVNRTLDQRVQEARTELALSEDRRRALEVAQAIEEERTRLMREMHDGIGSNIVTALAIAVREAHPPNTINTLRRALADLKLTVDSLEPFSGNVVALMGNFRHRVEPDLRSAGLRSRWRVDDCPPLPWLDAAKALHLLRIFQEALSNVIAHANATEVEFGCLTHAYGERQGLTIFLADNSEGFHPQGCVAVGQGLRSMESRARSIHAQYECVSQPGVGTRISLWLPRDPPFL